MADDLGYSDLGCYGGEIQTPNPDYLAEQGIPVPGGYGLITTMFTRNAGSREKLF